MSESNCPKHIMIFLSPFYFLIGAFYLLIGAMIIALTLLKGSIKKTLKEWSD